MKARIDARFAIQLPANLPSSDLGAAIELQRKSQSFSVERPSGHHRAVAERVVRRPLANRADVQDGDDGPLPVRQQEGAAQIRMLGGSRPDLGAGPIHVTA